MCPIETDEGLSGNARYIEYLLARHLWSRRLQLLLAMVDTHTISVVIKFYAFHTLKYLDTSSRTVSLGLSIALNQLRSKWPSPLLREDIFYFNYFKILYARQFCYYSSMLANNTETLLLRYC